MSRVHASADGDFPPATFVDALTDFGPSRSQIWGNSSNGHLIMHDRGDTWADVTEGTDAGGIWQRYRYDWADQHLVRLTVTDSNAFGVGSYWEYRLTPLEGGARTRMDLTINRNPTTAKGKRFDLLLRLIGGLYFSRDLRRSVRRIEQLSPASD